MAAEPLAPTVFDSRTWHTISPDPHPDGWERVPRGCEKHLRQVLPKGCVRKPKGGVFTFFRSPWAWITAHELLLLARERWKRGEGVRSLDGKLYHGGALLGVVLNEAYTRELYDQWQAERALAALDGEGK